MATKKHHDDAAHNLFGTPRLSITISQTLRLYYTVTFIEEKQYSAEHVYKRGLHLTVLSKK